MTQMLRQVGRGTGWLAAAAIVLSLTSCRLMGPRPAPDLYIGPVKARDARAPQAAAPAAPAAASPAPAAPADAPEGAAAPAAKPVDVPSPEKPLAVSVEDAILLALEHNQGLVVQRLSPEIARTYEGQARAIFDPLLSAWIGDQRIKGEKLAGIRRFDYLTDSVVGGAAIGALLPTGTSVELGATTAVIDENSTEQLVESRVGMTLSQALLRGASPRANLAAIRQARLDTLGSEYELRGFAESLVAEVEKTYWDCVLGEMQAEIFAKSVEVAQERLRATGERIRAGTLSETERVAAEAALARRREELINAQSDLAKMRLLLLRQLNLPGGNLWTRQVELPDPPRVPFTKDIDDVESHVQVAMRLRPDLNQARLGIRRGDLEIVRTENGLLPKMDLFITLGKSGYARSFGNSWANIDGRNYDMLFGVRGSYPVMNHDARARYERAVLTRRHADEAVKNLEQLVQVDVRTAYIEVQRAREQIAATEATRRLREESYRAEVERNQLGRATSLDVARAHRDLVDSETAVAETKADYLKALVELYRLDGSLLGRRGIAAPGAGEGDKASEHP